MANQFAQITMELQGSKQYAFYRVKVKGINNYSHLIALWNNPCTTSGLRKTKENDGWRGVLNQLWSLCTTTVDNSFLRMLQEAKPYSQTDTELYYSDVLIKIPIHEYDLLSNPAEICREFEKEHAKSINSKQYYRGRRPSYRINPTNALHKGELEFLFGDSVFIPYGEDDMRWLLSWHRVLGEPWQDITWYPGTNDLVALYRGQANPLVIGPEQNADSNKGESPVVISKKQWQGLPYACIKVVIEPHDNTLKIWAEREGETNAFCHKSYNLQEGRHICVIGKGQEQIELRLTSVDGGVASDADEKVLTMTGGAENSSSGMVNFVESCLHLEGIFLPHVDTMASYQGNVGSWEFYINDKNRIVFNEKADNEDNAESGTIRISCSSEGVTQEYSEKETGTFGAELNANRNFTLDCTASSIITQSAFFVSGCSFAKTHYPLESGDNGTILCGRADGIGKLGPYDINLANCFKGQVIYPQEYGRSRREYKLLSFCISKEQAEFSITSSGILRVQQKSKTFPICCLQKNGDTFSERWVLEPRKYQSNTAVSGEYLLLGSCLFLFKGASLTASPVPSLHNTLPTIEQLEIQWDNVLREYGKKIKLPDNLAMIERLERLDRYFREQMKKQPNNSWRWENMWIGTQNFFQLYRQGERTNWTSTSLLELLLFSKRYIVLLRQTLRKNELARITKELQEMESNLEAAIQTALTPITTNPKQKSEHHANHIS